MLIRCLRRLQNWNLDAVFSEYRFFAKGRTRYSNEQCIELFDIDLVTITDDPPQWLANQLETDCQERHEFDALTAQGRVDQSDTMQDDEKAPSYLAYRYSSSGPLNSHISGTEPRIQIL